MVPGSAVRRDRPVFWLLALIVVAAGVELGSRVLERVENAAARRENPYIEPVNPVPAFEVVDLGGRKMVRRSGFQPLVNRDDRAFPLERPEGGLRVFVLGGSAAAGWPYHLGENNLSALLERKLRMLLPGRPVEVINMAAGTYASHRVRLILEEALRYHPDAIFLYNGNNELLESVVYRLRTPPRPWDLSAAARLVYRAATALAVEKPRFDVRSYEIGAQLPTHLAFAFGQPSLYREDPRQFQALLESYRFNLEAMVASAGEARVPLFLVTCPVNLKDWLPNVSRHRKDLAPEERARFVAGFREGFLAVERGNLAAAIAPLQAALAVDDEYAEAHFLLAEALRGTGDAAGAKAEYVAALRRDAFPFRELPEFQEILREVAARRRVPLVDVVPPLEAVAGDGIPGFDVFVDYVHLTERSQEIVSQELLRALAGGGLLPGVSAAAIEGARIAIAPEFIPEAEVFAADVNYNMALAMHQYARLETLYSEAIAVFGRAATEDPRLAEDCRMRIALFRAIHATAGRYRDLLRAEKLGELRERYAPEEAQAIFDEYAEMIYQTRATSLSREEFYRRIPAGPLAGRSIPGKSGPRRRRRRRSASAAGRFSRRHSW